MTTADAPVLRVQTLDALRAAGMTAGRILPEIQRDIHRRARERTRVLRRAGR